MALIYLTNSYLEDADDYLIDHPQWEEVTQDQKDQALVDATMMLNENQWIGVAVSELQSLAWPRKTTSFFDPVLGLNVPVAEGEIPIRLQKATAQQALHLIQYPEVTEDYYATTYNTIRVGPVALESNAIQSRPPKVPRVPVSVGNLIRPLLQVGVGNSWWRSN